MSVATAGDRDRALASAQLRRAAQAEAVSMAGIVLAAAVRRVRRQVERLPGQPYYGIRLEEFEAEARRRNLYVD